MKKAVILLLVILLSALAADFAFFKLTVRNYKNYCEKTGMVFENYMRYTTYEKPDKNNANVIYKNFIEDNAYLPAVFPVGYKGKNAPILLFGCSYAWLEPQAFQNLLAKYTKRPVLNYSYWGWGPQQMLYFLQNPLFYETVENEFLTNGFKPKTPQYAVYVYVWNQKNRQQEVQDYFLDYASSLEYVENGGNLEIKKHSALHNLIFKTFTYKYFKRNYTLKHQSEEEKYRIMQRIFEESFAELKRHYPNIKFVILNYDQKPEPDERETEMFEKLKSEGFLIINSADLTAADLLSPDLTGDDNIEPNEKAWEIITPKFVKRYSFR